MATLASAAGPRMITFLLDAKTEPARVVRHAQRARRLRLEVPSLRGDRYVARRLEDAAGTWPGVLDVHAEPRTGRMLVHYAPDAPLLQRLHEEPALSPIHRRPVARRKRAEQRPWHALSVEETLGGLKTGTAGISSKEASRRLRLHGSNWIEEMEERSRLGILASQVANVPMAMLGGSAAVSALLGDQIDVAAILVVIGLNAGIGYQIESRNQQLIRSWRRLEPGTTQVIRGGVLYELPAADLVPGDVILVRAGDVIPADARVLDAHRLATDEAPLTGESEPASKGPEPVLADAPLGDRHSMLHAGTLVATGHGRAVVVATGLDTELARIRSLVEEGEPPKPPMARQLEHLSRQVAAGALGVSAVTSAAGLLHGKPPRQVVRSAVALAVAALPEGLPLVATSALVRSMQRLHEHGMVVRRVAAAESLGAVTVICADKTGTLTRNEMSLEAVDLGEGPIAPEGIRARRDEVLDDRTTLALAAALLNSDVDVQGRGKGAAPSVIGSSTESALVDAALRSGLDGAELRRRFPRRRLEERSAGVHYVVSEHAGPDGKAISFIKGAPEQVVERCGADGFGPLDDDRRAFWLNKNTEMAGRGLRVLALALAREDGSGWELIGLVGLRDPIRGGAAETIERARVAGIRTVILTGDHLETARAVARDLGLGGQAFAAADLLGLEPRELSARLSGVSVLARVSPEDKVSIVKALRASGEIVAMAGDGINDAPALRIADVGIAVGARAADLARQVADVVMAGEDLRSIVSAVGEGRIVRDNLGRALRFLFATNLSELTLMLGASLVGARDPLTPMQLLWINLLTDTIPALALALEPGDPDILDRPPPARDGIGLDVESRRQILRDGGLLAAAGATGLILGGPPAAFGLLTTAQISYAWFCRAPGARHTAGKREADRRFAALVGGGLALQLAAVTVPPLRRLLSLAAPHPLTLAVWAAGASLPLLAGGIGGGSVIVRKGVSYQENPT